MNSRRRRRCGGISMFVFASTGVSVVSTYRPTVQMAAAMLSIPSSSSLSLTAELADDNTAIRRRRSTAASNEIWQPHRSRHRSIDSTIRLSVVDMDMDMDVDTVEDAEGEQCTT